MKTLPIRKVAKISDNPFSNSIVRRLRDFKTVRSGTAPKELYFLCSVFNRSDQGDMKIPLCQSLPNTKVVEAVTVSRIICQFTAKTWFSAISRVETSMMRRLNLITEELDDRKLEIEVRLRVATLLRVLFSPIS